MVKGVDDRLAGETEPEKVLDDIEKNSTSLLDFLNSDHRAEIIRALTFIESPVEQAIIIKRLAKKLGIPAADIRNEIIKRAPAEPKGDTPFKTLEPWEEPVDGNTLLNELVDIFRSYCVMPENAPLTVALWVLLTYLLDVIWICPLLALQSAEKRSGKTTLLSLLQFLCFRAIASSNITPAAIFRAVEMWHPTLLIDEADTFIKDNDELRGVLNSGHTRSTAYVIRTTGDNHEPKLFSTWAPKAIALIGVLPPTLVDRSHVIFMKRKMPDEKIKRLKLNNTGHLEEIGRKCLRWANDNCSRLQSDTNTPQELHDRAADNWTPLLAIADLIGGDWPQKARTAALSMAGCEDQGDTSGVILLRDIRDYFDEHNDDKVASADLCDYLDKMEDRPWPEWKKGHPITPRQIARLLQPFDIVPGTIRINVYDTAKGYKKESFDDAFARYLPDLSVTTSRANKDATKRDIRSVTPENDVTDKKNGKASNGASCVGVTDKKGGKGQVNEDIIEMEVSL